MSEYGSDRRINVTRLWSGGLATAVVAALVILVGTLVARGILHVPVLAPEEAGYFGDATTAVYAGMAAAAALIATALLHLLLLSAPRPMTFFGWIVGLATVVAAVSPFAEVAPLGSQIATGAINAVTGIAIVSLLTSVGWSSFRSGRGTRRTHRDDGTVPGTGYGGGNGYGTGYRNAVDRSTRPIRRYDGRHHRDGDTNADTRIERD
ncbi:hypothetical protein HNR23_003682 [Nocardiopsis mwathae]|uniref:Uncharacterized protein n=1 Tax=Nocardiopsis mwathae TaxID=1472723 RepID=A0A7W9YK25_9ACTN|nr:DUF6069 family protein [Nocardiopsis mwathae]MBB6173622.1 hypothetical protein [Nocardiopsis mwathae]